MTHKDIYTKFMIEYDKQNVASSYPSLTKYEVATVLDKAYNALIAQKVTGNNPRRSGLETDIKSVSDLQPLIKSAELAEDVNDLFWSNNIHSWTLPNDFLYYISLQWNLVKPSYADRMNGKLDGIESSTNAKLVSTDMFSQFLSTVNNRPWIATPVCVIADNRIQIAIDPEWRVAQKMIKGVLVLGKPILRYIAQPKMFTDKESTDATPFELNDTMAEELISLAITFALENVESTRLTAHANLRGLES